MKDRPKLSFIWPIMMMLMWAFFVYAVVQNHGGPTWASHSLALLAALIRGAWRDNERS